MKCFKIDLNFKDSEQKMKKVCKELDLQLNIILLRDFQRQWMIKPHQNG
jgi:hypothetical protein